MKKRNESGVTGKSGERRSRKDGASGTNGLTYDSEDPDSEYDD
tara:strand:- start:1473 stop:1601 length:129 start_codon:yes stop_codon:yes gene_type:complete